MSKFKVGDKVRVKRTGRIGTICRVDESLPFPYWLRKDPSSEPFCSSELESREPSKSTREFIVIRRDGQQVIASHKRGDEIIKTAKATCSPSDEFDFNVGAKLAFDRLTGTEKKKEPKPPYVPRVCDRVRTEFGVGTVVSVTAGVSGSLVIVAHDKWKKGHNANATSLDRAIGLVGGRSWYFCTEDLKPLNED